MPKLADRQVGCHHHRRTSLTMRKLSVPLATVMLCGLSAACTPTTPGELYIGGMELVQTTQVPSGAVPILAGKKTFLRVFPVLTPRADGAPVDVVVKATVRSPDGEQHQLQKSLVMSRSDGARDDADTSILVEIPPDLVDTTGVLGVTAAVTADGAVRSTRNGAPATRQKSVIIKATAPDITIIPAYYRYTHVPEAMVTWLRDQGASFVHDSTWGPADPQTLHDVLPLVTNLLPVRSVVQDQALPVRDQKCEASQDDQGNWGCGDAYASARRALWKEGESAPRCARRHAALHDRRGAAGAER